MDRRLSLAVLALAVLAVIAGYRFTQQGGTDEGCDGVRQAYERAGFVERGGSVPTSQDYRRNSIAIRQAALEAPPAVAQDLRRIGDAYATLAQLFTGFDPGDDATYDVIEDNTSAIEAQQAQVDEALPAVDEWLRSRCM